MEVIQGTQNLAMEKGEIMPQEAATTWLLIRGSHISYVQCKRLKNGLQYVPQQAENGQVLGHCERGGGKRRIT